MNLSLACLNRALTAVPLVLVLLLCCRARAQQSAQPGPHAGDRELTEHITFPDSLLMQNGGPILNIRRPPEAGMHAAKGDGVADDTDAFRDAYDLLKREFVKNGPWSRADYYIYIPNGTYKVSDTLIYRGPSVGAAPKWDGKFDVNHLRFVGESRARTVIRLADNAPGYQDAQKPKILMAFQHPDTVFNNVPGGNWLRNLTLDTGRGNAGAAALYFQGANNSDLHNISIRSQDGAGLYGIWFKNGSIQGYYSDVSIEGFDYGIAMPTNAEGDVAFEYLTLRNQKLAGIEHTGGGMSLRALLCDQRRTGASAIKIDGSGPQMVILDSVLQGRILSGPAIEMTRDAEQCLFARNVSTSGFSSAIRKAGRDAVVGHSVDEYVSYPIKSLRAGQVLASLRLPIEDTPRVPWFNPATQWAIVDDYTSVQAAFNSGKPVVVFKKRAYKLPGDVRVPASVQSIQVLGSKVEGGAFIINEAGRDPVLVADSGGDIRVQAQRNVIQKCSGGGISNEKGLPVTFYLENVNDNATGDNFCKPGQKVFARQIDIEYGNANQIVCNGGTMWVFGFKTENGTSTPFTVKNGGFLEILGGYVNATAMSPPDKQNPLIRNDNGNVSATLFLNMTGQWANAIEETRGRVKAGATNTEFPARGGGYRSNYVVPLYVGQEQRLGQTQR